MLNSDKVKEKLSTEDVIRLFCELQGSDDVLYDTQGHPIFCTSICHGGDSQKLYYYPETKLTHCFTCGESHDIFDIVQRAKGCDFKEAFNYIIHFFKLRHRGFKEEPAEQLIDDWDILQKIQVYSVCSQNSHPIQEIQENLIEYFYPLAAPQEWIDDGISPEVMRHYNIRIDSALEKIIIEHRDLNGKLIGIRGRTYNPKELEEGKKYMPIMIEKDLYNHPLGQNLYGLFNNKQTIQKIKKAFVVEGEKGVLQLATMYGINNCFAVATCGSSFSRDQVDLLLSLGVEEIVIGYDREFVGSRGEQSTIEYEQKIIKTVSPFLPYVNISYIMDYDHLTPYKASPVDCGKDIFETLYHNRVKLYYKDASAINKEKRGKVCK